MDNEVKAFTFEEASEILLKLINIADNLKIGEQID